MRKNKYYMQKNVNISKIDEMLDIFIDEVCSTLKIEKPNISGDISNFESETMTAQYGTLDNTIYVDYSCIFTKSPVDFFFAIAHELRHIWQIKYYSDSYFPNYEERSDSDNLEKYNLQFSEIDANAFGAIVIGDFFGVKLLFNNFTSKVRKKIEKRIDYILKNNVW